MIYLLDVNALIALALVRHAFHEHVARWMRDDANGARELATCAVTELGFVRVLAQVPDYNVTVSQARALLMQLKRSKQQRFEFIIDDHDADRLPNWVKSPRQTTDGHLVELARAHGAVLATFDRRITGAFTIPAA